MEVYRLKYHLLFGIINIQIGLMSLDECILMKMDQHGIPWEMRINISLHVNMVTLK